jgi:putative ABC transport system permease protein
MVLVVVFAILAALLGALGVYGVLAWFVRQRRQEIGVRLALGASRADVVWLVVRQGALVALAGIVPGLVGALALSSVLEGLLFGVQATDPWTFVLVPLLLMAVVLAASFLPARAAARVDPMISLRAE